MVIAIQAAIQADVEDDPRSRHIAGPVMPFVNSFVSFVMNLPALTLRRPLQLTRRTPVSA